MGMARYYCFKIVHETTDGVAAFLTEIPGVRVQPTRYAGGPLVFMIENAAWIVEQWLTEMKIEFKVKSMPTPLPAVDWENTEASLSNIQGLKPWVPAFMKPFQREGVAFALQRDDALYFWAPGSGKTLGAIVWALARPGKIVVVTKAGARRQWQKDGIAYFTTEDVEVIEDASPREKYCTARFTILGWETLPAHIDGLVAAKPTSVIFDEIHKAKSHKRWQAIPVRGADGLPTINPTTGQPAVTFLDKKNIASSAAKLSKVAKRRLGTTASPIRDRIRDLWAQLDLVQPRSFGKNRAFLTRYAAAAPNPWGGLNTKGRSNIDELVGRLSFHVHQVPHSVTHAQLPPKRRRVDFISRRDLIELPKAEQEKFTRELKAAWARGKSAIVEVQLAEACARKRPVVVDRVAYHARENGKVVVFTGRRRDCDTLERSIKRAVGDDVQVWAAHGDTDIRVREQIREDFMAHPGPCVLVGTGEAWGESLNLQDTDYALFAMLPYTPGQLEQWEGRFSRLQQKRPVLIDYLIAEGTADERVADILINKLPAVEQVLGEGGALAGLADALGGADNPALVDSLLDKILGGVT